MFNKARGAGGHSNALVGLGRQLVEVAVLEAVADVVVKLVVLSEAQ